MCLVISLLIFFRSFFPYKPKESPCAKLFAHAWKKNVEEFVKLQMAASKKRGPSFKMSSVELPSSSLSENCCRKNNLSSTQPVFVQARTGRLPPSKEHYLSHPTTPPTSKTQIVANDHTKTFLI